jgi:hypothetical protein
MRRPEGFPFRPKSTVLLREGQFWAVPFEAGRFACGRVLQVGAELVPVKSRGFFGGLHRWVGASEPTSADIAGVEFVSFGVMHIRAITQTGGAVLGERALEHDAIEVPLHLSQPAGEGTMLLRGANVLRPARRDEWHTLPVLGYWGYDFIVQLAKHHLSVSAA